PRGGAGTAPPEQRVRVVCVRSEPGAPRVGAAARPDDALIAAARNANNPRLRFARRPQSALLLNCPAGANIFSCGVLSSQYDSSSLITRLAWAETSAATNIAQRLKWIQ